VSRPSEARLRAVLQEFVDGSIMEMIGTAELEGSAYAGVQQGAIAALVQVVERELGIVLNTYGDLDHTYWTPEQHDRYQREHAA